VLLKCAVKKKSLSRTHTHTRIHTHLCRLPSSRQKAVSPTHTHTHTHTHTCRLPISPQKAVSLSLLHTHTYTHTLAGCPVRGRKQRETLLPANREITLRLPPTLFRCSVCACMSVCVCVCVCVREWERERERDAFTRQLRTNSSLSRRLGGYCTTLQPVKWYGSRCHFTKSCRKGVRQTYHGENQYISRKRPWRKRTKEKSGDRGERERESERAREQERLLFSYPSLCSSVWFEKERKKEIERKR